MHQLRIIHGIDVGLAWSHGCNLPISCGVLRVLLQPHSLASMHIALLILQMLIRISEVELLIWLHLRGTKISMATLRTILILSLLLIVFHLILIVEALLLAITGLLLATSSRHLRRLRLLLILLHQLLCHCSKFEL